MHVDSTTRHVKTNQQTWMITNIPCSNNAIYLEIDLDVRFRWKKTPRPNIQKMYYLFRTKFQFFIHNKILLYKQIFNHIWICKIQLFSQWKIKLSRTKFLDKSKMHTMVLPEWSFAQRSKNSYSHDRSKKYARKHKEKFHSHVNTEVLRLLDNAGMKRRPTKRNQAFRVQYSAYK